MNQAGEFRLHQLLDFMSPLFFLIYIIFLEADMKSCWSGFIGKAPILHNIEVHIKWEQTCYFQESILLEKFLPLAH